MLAEVYEVLKDNEQEGFVIITAAAGQEMVNIHDRKPLVLSSELAREEINPATTAERAEEIAQDGCRPAADFKWHPVSKLVGNVRNQGPEVITPVLVTPEG
ncbi:SOS response-associated peptidase family protein [Pseudomonas sp. LM20]|nr:SOS response-associated peptidase family protein [Pseudomonas sp. LM20]